MRIQRRTREGGRAVGALIGAMLLGGAALAAVWLRLGLPVPPCRFRQLTGLPCPTCGSTRLVEALLSGRVLEAAALNPFMFAGVAVVVAWALVSTAGAISGRPTWRLVLTAWERRALVFLVVIFLIASWGYLVLRGI